MRMRTMEKLGLSTVLVLLLTFGCGGGGGGGGGSSSGGDDPVVPYFQSGDCAFFQNHSEIVEDLNIDGTADRVIITNLAFDADGNKKSWIQEVDSNADGSIDQTISRKYIYNAQGKISQVTDGSDQPLMNYLYDSSTGRLASIAYPAHNYIEYFYYTDSSSRFTTKEVEYDVDADGTIDSISTYSYTYEDISSTQIRKTENTDDDSNGVIDEQKIKTITRDAQGNIVNINYMEDSDYDRVVDYAYESDRTYNDQGWPVSASGYTKYLSSGGGTVGIYGQSIYSYDWDAMTLTVDGESRDSQGNLISTGELYYTFIEICSNNLADPRDPDQSDLIEF